MNEAEPTAAAGSTQKTSRPQTRAAWVLLSPFLIGFALFFVAPFLVALAQSVTRPRRDSVFGPTTTAFAGLFNYTTALSDPNFLASFGRVLAYSVVQIPVMLLFALVLALLLDSGTAKFARFFRLTFFLPHAVPGLIGGLIWLFLYAPGISPFERLLEPVGGLPDLLGGNLVIFSMENITTWTFTGYNMLIMYSALRAIPSTLYEAARIDGAGAWSLAWHIKIPNIAPAIVLTGVFSIIGTFQLFTEPMALLPLASGVSNSYTPTMAAYNQISAQNFGLGAAMSVILAAVIAALSIIFVRITQKRASA